MKNNESNCDLIPFMVNSAAKSLIFDGWATYILTGQLTLQTLVPAFAAFLGRDIMRECYEQPYEGGVVFGATKYMLKTNIAKPGSVLVNAVKGGVNGFAYEYFRNHPLNVTNNGQIELGLTEGGEVVFEHFVEPYIGKYFATLSEYTIGFLFTSFHRGLPIISTLLSYELLKDGGATRLHEQGNVKFVKDTAKMLTAMFGSGVIYEMASHYILEPLNDLYHQYTAPCVGEDSGMLSPNLEIS